MMYTLIIFNNAELNDRLTVRIYAQDAGDRIDRLITLYRNDPKCKNIRIMRDVESIMFA